MFDVKKNYVVGIVLDNDLKETLLLERVNEPYSGTINGVGGKVEEGEGLEAAMIREMQEETDIKMENVKKVEYLVTLYYPKGVLLNVFYIILNDSYQKKEVIDTREGKLKWFDYIKDGLYDARKPKVAGEGNVAFFINYALINEGIDTSKSM